MTKNIRAIGAAILVTIWVALTGFAWFSPAKDTSEAERRPLAQFPELSGETINNGKFMTEFEDYTLDQFPGRDIFRQLKSLTHYYVLLLIIISFVLFNAETLTQAGSDLACMFGFGGIPLVTEATLYYLRSYGVLFVVAFIGATPLVKTLAEKVEHKPIGAILEPVVTVLLLVVCTAYLVDGSFNPFLYFRF